MIPTSRDTKAAAEAMHLAIMRRAGARRRVALAIDLSSSMIRASRRAIARRHPEWTERDVVLHWAELHYGVAIAAAVRARLDRDA